MQSHQSLLMCALVKRMILRYSASMSSDGLLTRITVDPNICHGKPCIRGLRYPVEWLLELLSSGMSEAQILADYPDLEQDDLRAVCAYGARLSRVQRIEPVVG
jgi:uncharacterized protein (DUF433 family)